MRSEPHPQPPARSTASWSLHRRLAVGLVLCIGGTFAAIFPMLDRLIDHAIYRQMDFTLSQRATAVGRMLQDSAHQHPEALMPEYEPGGHMEFFTVFDQASGAALLRSPSSAGAVLPAEPAAEGTPRFYDVTLPDGHAGRAIALRLPMPGSPDRLLVVATEREEWDRTERRVHLALLAGIALATLLATGSALLVVQRVIVVLRRTGAAAARLNADQPMQPLGGDLPRELKPFADAFNLGLRHLYAAVERERQFSRDVAHELRTPLAEIRLSAESALGSDDAAQARRSLAASVSATQRMQRSVDTLLLLARLDSGQHTPAPDPIDLSSLVRELLAALASLQARRTLAVQPDLPPSAWVQGDLGIIERIISNLLRNALEYAPEGDAIGCRLERGDAGWLLTIANAAPELQESDLEHLGHRFWRKQSEGGTAHHAGLGLALAFSLARAIDLPLRFSLQDGRLTARLGPWTPLV